MFIPFLAFVLQTLNLNVFDQHLRNLGRCREWAVEVRMHQYNSNVLVLAHISFDGGDSRLFESMCLLARCRDELFLFTYFFFFFVGVWHSRLDAT